MPPKRNYPCGKCQKNCVSSMCVLCGKCDKWFHAHCEGLSQPKMQEMKEIPQDFTCTGCSTSWGVFDFSASVGRLGAAAKNGLQSLQSAVDMELIILRGRKPFKIELGPINYGEPDQVTNYFISRCGGTNGKTAVKADGDGNCLFNALSISTYGDQSKAAEIRTWTCIEMVQHKEYYKRLNKNSEIRLVSPDYEEACIKCATNTGYSSAYTMQAAASALGVTVHSVYPQLNGMLDRCVFALNTSFYPRPKKITERSLYNVDKHFYPQSF